LCPSLLVPIHVRGERGRCQGGISVGVAWRIGQASGDRVVISKLIKDIHEIGITGIICSVPQNVRTRYQVHRLMLTLQLYIILYYNIIIIL